MNSLALLKERAETRSNRRKSLAEIQAAICALRGAAEGVSPEQSAKEKGVETTADDASPEAVRKLIAEARALAGGLAVEQQEFQQLQNELAKARGIARARALVLATIAVILAPFAILQLW